VTIPQTKTIEIRDVTQPGFLVVAIIDQNITDTWGIDIFLPRRVEAIPQIDSTIFIKTRNQVLVAAIGNIQNVSLITQINLTERLTSTLNFDIAAYSHSLVLLYSDPSNNVSKMDVYSINDFQNIFLRKSLNLYSYKLNSSLTFKSSITTGFL